MRQRSSFHLRTPTTKHVTPTRPRASDIHERCAIRHTSIPDVFARGSVRPQSMDRRFWTNAIVVKKRKHPPERPVYYTVSTTSGEKRGKKHQPTDQLPMLLEAQTTGETRVPLFHASPLPILQCRPREKGKEKGGRAPPPARTEYTLTNATTKGGTINGFLSPFPFLPSGARPDPGRKEKRKNVFPFAHSPFFPPPFPAARDRTQEREKKRGRGKKESRLPLFLIPWRCETGPRKERKRKKKRLPSAFYTDRTHHALSAWERSNDHWLFWSGNRPCCTDKRTCARLHISPLTFPRDHLPSHKLRTLSYRGAKFHPV
jgi:hypothetical protein